MVYQGTVQNGMIVFPVGVQLPEGASVNVEVLTTSVLPTELSSADDALLRMGELAIETGIPDLALNIDHYLYGHPKVTNGQ
jgi:hypothetical protein